MQFLTDVFQSRRGILQVDGVSVLDLAEKAGTPVYVTAETRLRQNYRRLCNAFTSAYGGVRIYYSMKANSNLSILKIMLEEGAYLDALSPGEIYLGLKAGFPASKIMYTGTSVGVGELEYAVERGVTVNIDSLPELVALLRRGAPETISVRLNPEIGSGHHEHVITGGRSSKFGLWEKDVLKAYSMAKDAGVKRFGIHMHIGSGILDPAPYLAAVKRLLETADEVRQSIGVEFDFIDIGGGFGVPYKPDEQELDISNLAENIARLIRSKWLGKDEMPTLCVEPGRYIVCDSTIMLTRVNLVKKTPYKTFIGVDAGFNTLIRPVMYQSYHHIVVANKLDREAAYTYDVVGPICESGDVLGRGRKLPEVEGGDLLAIFNAGAYGYSMSSQYNSWPRPAEVLVKNGECEVIRNREEYSDLIRGQRVASWLN